MYNSAVVELTLQDNLQIYPYLSQPMHLLTEETNNISPAVSENNMCAVKCVKRFCMNRSVRGTSRKHTYIILTPLNPTFI